MKSILDSLKSVQTKKDIVTTIEYDCQSSAKEEEVFDLVWGILQNDLDSFSKITYDVDSSEHRIKVEVSQHA
jgi:hypothetical protein